MKKMAIFLGIAVLALASVAGAENPQVFDLPMMQSPPTLDGIHGAAEWAGALELECSPSQILRDGAEFGWRDIETQQSEVSVNQLVASDDEDAADARTDADYSSMIWQAWDADALYYIIEARDNIHDVEGAGVETNWWERDSMTLYVDLVNSREEYVPTEGGYVYERARMNLLNFIAAPQQSSSITITWERMIQDTRTPTQDPDDIEGMEYGYRDAGDEFGGEADYVIEGMVPWYALARYNLPEIPTVGSEMGFVWLACDPDNDEAYGGQIQCSGWADKPVDYSTWIFSDTPAGVADGTAVETDSWGAIKATF
jgi:cellulose/xylan binding protein with CBM9 domain